MLVVPGMIVILGVNSGTQLTSPLPRKADNYSMSVMMTMEMVMRMIGMIKMAIFLQTVTVWKGDRDQKMP